MGNCYTAVIEPLGFKIPDIAPSPDRVGNIVVKKGPKVLKDYEQFADKYKRGMESAAPESYVCEEVISKDTGYMKLTKDKDDEKKVKKVALLAATGDNFRTETKKEVWFEVKPEVSSAANEFKFARTAVIKAAHEGCDRAVDKAIDNMYESMAKKLEKGEPLAEEETK